MQFYCSRGMTFIFDEPVYLTSKVSINQQERSFFVNRKHCTEQTAAPHCLATPHRLLLLIHSSVRCQGLALMKIELQTHLHPRPKKCWTMPCHFHTAETNLRRRAGIHKPNDTFWCIDRMRRGRCVCVCGWWRMWMWRSQTNGKVCVREENGQRGGGKWGWRGAFIQFYQHLFQTLISLRYQSRFRVVEWRKEEQIAFKFYGAFPVDGTDWDVSPSN